MPDPRLRILLIDDDPVDRTAIVRHFKTHGLPYDVVQARSLADAAPHMRDGAFDAVLLDYMLGDGNGLELMQALGRTPAIVLSGAGNEQIAVQAMRQGAYDYLIKDVAGSYLSVLPAAIVNVVQRRRAEDALRESEARHRAIFDAAGDAIMMLRDGFFVECNPAALRIFGCVRDELIGHPPFEFSPPRQPDGRDSREKALELIGAALAGQPQSFEWRHVRKDGSLFDTEVTLTRLELSGETLLQAIVRDVTARRRAEKELREYAAALEAANERLEDLHAAAQVATRSKSEFLANMSHEIRTPLTAIMGFAEIVLSEGDISRAPPHRIEAINAILRNSSYLLHILNDILDLSKIEAGRLEVERVVCAPVQMVADVLHLMQVRADAKHLPLLAEFAGPIPETIRSDPTRLRQVLINLIGNAVKFTEKGSIRLVVRLLPDRGDGALLQFEIIDTGIGMEAHEVARLFQPFTQADNSTSRRFGGTGLGLTISKRLTEMLGGSIAVESRPGAGSTFRATIATGPLDGVSLLTAPALGSIRAAETVDDVFTVAGQIQLPARVLLAEDAPDNQRLMSFILTKASADVTCADNGQIACELALAAWREGRSFDLVLMDMQMPVLDGYQATRALRDEGYAGKIIALTANAMAGQRELCLRAGCDDYVTKPINRQRLLTSLARHLVKPAAVAAGNDVY